MGKLADLMGIRMSNGLLLQAIDKEEHMRLDAICVLGVFNFR